MTTEELADDRVRAWFDHPERFVRELLRAEPEYWQDDVLKGAAGGPRTAVVGSKGCGKTTVLAWILLWFLFTRRKCNIAATSISGDNLRDGLWKEAALWLEKSPVLRSQFAWSSTRISSRAYPATWWASARSWAKSGNEQSQSETLAGLHAKYMLFLLDEAGSIPRAIMATAEAALSSGKQCLIVIGGNATSLTGPLYQAAVTHKADWHLVHINGDPDNPKRSTRVKIEWAKQQIAAYGRDNPWVRVNVFGEFPSEALNALLSVQEVRRAMDRRSDDYEWAQRRLGVDVARFGDDRTVFFPRQGSQAFVPKIMRKEPTTKIAAYIARLSTKWKQELTLVDDTGHWGHGVIDQLGAYGLPCIPVVYHDRAISPRYKNRRVEMWLEMAEWVKNGGCLPENDELIGELTEPTYSFSQGKFVLEDKDQVKLRLGRSPDLADALALTFAIPDMPAADPAQQLVPGYRGRHSRARVHDDDDAAHITHGHNYEYEQPSRRARTMDDDE